MEQKPKKKWNGIIGTLALFFALLLVVGLFAHVFEERETPPQDSASEEIEKEDIQLFPEALIF